MDVNEGRRKIWEANLASIQAGLMTGSGAGSHRAIYPVYLAKPLPIEYTHAENGYLQIATETGIGGIALVVAGIVLCGAWCFECLVRSKSANEQLYFGAVAAGLLASAVHSLVDFVWYIPACMSVVVILAACALRLSQFVQPAEQAAACTPQLGRSRWFELAAAGVLTCVWCTYTLFGPAMASIHWDRYLRASVNKSQVAWQQFTALVDGTETVDASVAERLLDVMIRHLEDAAYWDPAYERVQMRLAAKCVARFELLQQRAENAMPLLQLREAALASQFDSPANLRAWLHKAFGDNSRWLYRAYEHAHRAVTTQPLQGEAYLQLASLSFLDGSKRNVASAYANQGLRVRPYDPDVLYDAGNQCHFAGDVESALKYWKRCFAVYGKHQLRIIQTLAGPHVPAAAFLEEFRPDWSTLRSVWTRYHRFGNEQDQRILVDYAADVTKRQVREKSGGVPPEYILRWQASMYTEVGRSAEALTCLEQAYCINPHMYAIRLSLADALIHAKRYAEAEPHVRWCLARHPEDKTLKASLIEISKQRLAGLEKITVPLQ
jgi:tetratricopeptide (TPR) repeat protein